MPEEERVSRTTLLNAEGRIRERKHRNPHWLWQGMGLAKSLVTTVSD